MAKSSMAVSGNGTFWRGGLTVLVGILVLIWPGLTVLTMVTLLSIWLMVIGVSSIVEGVGGMKMSGYGWLASVLGGLFEVGVGSYLVQRPMLITTTIVSLLGLVIVIQGFVHLFNVYMTNTSEQQKMLSLLYALVAFVAGVWLWRYPFHGTLAFVWLLGVYAIVSGALLVASGSDDMM